MTERTFTVAVAGATGAVGETMLRLLEERNFPVRRLRLLASERSAGTSLTFRGEEIKVERLSETSFQGVEIALFSAGATRSQEFAPAAVKAGAVVIDNSSAFRMDPHIPLIVPEINPDALAGYRARGIIANPNCTTIVMVMPLKPLHDYGRIRRVIATSYQAVSGAGAKGIEELRRQTLAWASGKPIEISAFPKQIAFNVIPHIDVFQPNGYTKEELKLVFETRKILGDESIGVSPTTVRVPVFTAHSVAINVETERRIEVDKAKELLSTMPGLVVFDEPEAGRYPVPLLAAGKDECFVGRIRADLSNDHAINLWVVGDQLRKGAALNAIQIAELLIDRYL
ncbi:semialdehyde dehydrogenase [Candidatus Methylomirabilis lanthanidiphila]|uniref:Aspartate-semialdehyde dehydrogenase n=1 Tax=Candidatus Methylomirabilis lanthanidiphila TaxID=2211376 RepID=A0A564ZG98_9BACT|nr:aspartate-semialdehyde dehydrogenase [Candidatus Methylomirabilis lanthanidiphila]VUZ84193.1 semialdehyde dehydrogenase [Candidatus Methylomirabilis lanthanidiphila]